MSLLKRIITLLPGFLLIAAVIWLAGPYLVISGSRPLESESSRLTAIILVVLAWLAWVVFERWQARRASGQLASAVIDQAAAEPLPSGDVVKLRESFEQAVATLGSRHKGRTLYDLPWYVFIGPPGSGKTTALLNSGLHFSLDASGGQARLKGVGGTRNCDWWFTDEAVFLDTAGRFTTQDSDASADSAGWREFLALLTKYRKRRPINGVILTISVKDLLTQGEHAREQQIEAARYRLRELGRELQIELPVYVMVTMCDLIAGFTEYFDDQVQEGRAQVWGVTFPYDKTVSGQATRTFPSEFEALVTRLNERLFARLEDETDARRRARIFAFPQQVASLRDSLSQYITDLFATKSDDHRILLRGVYLTSGTQEGTPIDRLLGAIGRGFRVAPEAVAPGGRGKAYFVERLLTQVLINESGLAGVNRQLELRKAGAQLATYAGLVILTVVGVMVLSVSYRRNAEYLAGMEREVGRLRSVPPARSVTSVQGLLPRLDAIRAVVTAADKYNDSVPWGMRWGLYQGRAMANAARDAYLLELDASLLDFVAARLQQRLVQYGGEPEKLYEYLKAYLMLGQPEHMNEKHLQYLVNLEWSPANGVPHAIGTSLTQHFQALLDSDERLRPVPINAALVSQACNTVRRASMGRIMYSWLRQTYASNDSQGVRLDVAGGVATTQVIARKSGASLSQPLPSLFSRSAFEKITGSDLPELVEEFSKDNWVCDGGSDVGDRARLQNEVTNIYQQDYIAAWDAVVNDLVIVTPSTVDGMADLLGVLGGPTSPLKNLLDVITENTRLTQPAKAEAPADTGILAKGKSYADRVTTMFKQSGPEAPPPSTPGALVTAHFKDLHRLVEGEPGKTPLEMSLNRLREVEQQLRGFGAAYGQKSIEAAQGDPQLRNLFMQIGRESETLPTPVREMIEQIGTRAQTTVTTASVDALGAAYKQEVLAPCERLIAGRYPFSSSTREIPLTEFTELFGPKGVFDRFFTERLESRVDTSTRPWSWKPGTVPPYPGMLGRFEDARAIRDAFFGGGQLSLRFGVIIAAVDADTTQFAMEIDGQKFDDRKGGAAPGTWPGQNAGSASASFNDRTGIASGPRFEGPWALFRFIDAGQPRIDSDTRTTLTFRGRREHEAQIVIDAVSLDNPFAKREWQRFGCGS